jgi:hypothetical protein
VRHARQVASEFQTSIEQMAREAELSDVKKEIEDATRKISTDIQNSIDPVEVEKLFNEPSPPPPVTDPTVVAGPVPTIDIPLPDEPPLPFPEPVKPAPAASPEPAQTASAPPTPAPAGAEPGRDRG